MFPPAPDNMQLEECQNAQDAIEEFEKAQGTK
jgi:hypothetical protein